MSRGVPAAAGMDGLSILRVCGGSATSADALLEWFGSSVPKYNVLLLTQDRYEIPIESDVPLDDWDAEQWATEIMSDKDWYLRDSDVIHSEVTLVVE